MKLIMFLGIALLLLFFIFHGLFVMFDYAYNNPDSGAFTLLREQFNETMNAEQRDIAYDRSQLYMDFFSLGRVAFLATCIGCFVIAALDRETHGE